MTHAGAGTHHLYVAGVGAALVAEAVLMGDGTLADIGDDFHVGMGMGGKAVFGAISSSFHTRKDPWPILLGSW